MMESVPTLMDTSEILKYLKISRKKLGELLKAGLPRNRLGWRLLRYEREAVDAWMTKYTEKMQRKFTKGDGNREPS